MNKRRLMLLAVAACMVAILAVGGTLAYFTSEDKAENVFTMGNVQIDLKEDFVQNSELAPGLDINKDVWVENTGSKPAYVRVHIALPSVMDDGDPSFNAAHNFLHFNFTADSVQPGQWSWIPEMTDTVGYRTTGEGNWNFYTTTVDNVQYNVYVVTYRTAVAPGARTTTYALDKVYLDPTVDATANEDGTITYKDTKGNTVTMTADEAKNIKILVAAEGTQTDTFTDAYQALNTAFGVPGTYSPWPATTSAE